VLTPDAIDAVHRLHDAGLRFAITSGRPPRGMQMLVDPLDLHTPIAAFNGGLLVDRDMHVIEQRTIPEDLVGQVIDLMSSFNLDVWIYRGADWFVTDPEGPHVDREAWTVKFDPTVVDDYQDLIDDVAKIVGVSDDHGSIQKASEAAQEQFAQHVTAAASQPYYLDVTHPDANKGFVARYLATMFGLAESEVATIGDMPNDILMFQQSGLSIAMGNADPEAKEAADHVTASNEDEGFAKAVDDVVLPAAQPPG
jgi:Cof subfamily protein (haloacid dehalogenase superfamily)